MKKHHLSIWFLIGLQLVIMGLIVLVATIYGIFVPPADPVMFNDQHPGIYMGIVMLLLGAVYTIKFWPDSGKK